MQKNDLLSKILTCPIGFGGAAVSGEGGGYGFGEISETKSLELLHFAYEKGITLFDTAPIYGFGLSEKRLGKAFKSLREKVFFVSKSGVSWHENKRVNMTNDPLVAQKMLEGTLRDLQTDYVDLYMIHWPDSRVDIRRPLEVLQKAKIQGKIKHLGLSNTFKEDLEKAKEVCHIEVVQGPLSFFNRDLKDELFLYLKENSISFMAYGTLEKGILTGRVSEERKYDSSDARSFAPWWKESKPLLKVKRLEKIQPLLREKGYTSLELALGYVLSFDEVSVALCGCRSIPQIEGVLKALKHLPSKEELALFEC